MTGKRSKMQPHGTPAVAYHKCEYGVESNAVNRKYLPRVDDKAGALMNAAAIVVVEWMYSSITILCQDAC